MKIVLEIVAWWILLSCTLGTCLTWAWFYPKRRARDAHLGSFLDQRAVSKFPYAEVTAHPAPSLVSAELKDRNADDGRQACSSETIGSER
jgi:hypothetical protein